jgi:hypothetical protein
MADEARDLLEFHVDGERHTLDDLTFSELREYRAHVRELAGDEDLNPMFADPMDRYPVMYWLFKRRTDDAYTLEQALDLKMGDLLKAVKGKAKRPTRAR